MAGRRKREEIIIIGAGISGLAAGKELTLSGDYDIILLEARDRVGGRIWTDRSSFGTPIDLGASWIHGTINNPLFAFGQSQNIQMIETDNSSLPDTFQANGARLSDAERIQIDKLFRSVRDKLYDKQESTESLADKSLASAIENIIAKQKLSADELQGLRHLIATEIENDYATQTSNLSFKYWDKVNWFKGKDMILPGGYSQLTDILARNQDIRLNKQVIEIKHGSRGVEIITTDGGRLAADRAVVTLPLGVLKANSVKFTPALPAAKARAINGLQMGTFDKIYLRFVERFWSESATWIEYLGASNKLWQMFLSMWKFTREPVLVAFNVGDYAQTLESKSDEEIVTEAMQILRTMYGSNIPDPIFTKLTRWAKDPYACGSYSYVPVGSSQDLFDILAKPVASRVFFAGEATSSHDYSSAHAAYTSGLRAAAEVSQL